MKLHFDSKQEFQLEAVKAITDIFEGQPLSSGDFEFSISQSGALLTENGFGNKLYFTQLEQLSENIKRIQKNNSLKVSTKDENIINKSNDKLTGKKPVEFIQSCKPFVIVDEPQNMETEIRKRAIENLSPQCTLRYSATHTNLYNLMFSLNPVKAYDLGLVKQIEVDSVVSENDFNSAFLHLENITRTGNAIKAKIKIDANTGNGVKRKSVTASGRNLDLFLLLQMNDMKILQKHYKKKFRKIVELISQAEQKIRMTRRK